MSHITLSEALAEIRQADEVINALQDAKETFVGLIEDAAREIWLRRKEDWRCCTAGTAGTVSFSSVAEDPMQVYFKTDCTWCGPGAGNPQQLGANELERMMKWLADNEGKGA